MTEKDSLLTSWPERIGKVLNLLQYDDMSREKDSPPVTVVIRTIVREWKVRREDVATSHVKTRSEKKT